MKVSTWKNFAGHQPKHALPIPIPRPGPQMTDAPTIIIQTRASLTGGPVKVAKSVHEFSAEKGKNSRGEMLWVLLAKCDEGTELGRQRGIKNQGNAGQRS